MKKILLPLLVLSLLLSLCLSAGCSSADDTDAEATLQGWQETYTAGSFGIRSKKDPFVELTLSTGDSIRLELYPSVAPNSVANFVKYVKDGFYEGVVFHRIMRGFMIQTGGFIEQDGKIVQKDPTYPAIKGEFSSNGIRNDLSHTRGVLSMARTTAKDSATSQFFICSEITEMNTMGLDGQYAAFGRVIDEESMAVVSALEKVTTGRSVLYYGDYGATADDVPVEIVKITKATLVQA